MEIIKLHVLNGPAGSMHRKKLIQMTLDIGDLEFRPTNTIEGFSQRLKTLIPSLYSHRCTDGVPGSFLRNVDAGTCIVDVMAHIALELQGLAGMRTTFSSTEQTDIPGVYHIVFGYHNEDAGLYAALASVEIVEALIKGRPYFIRYDIERLKSIFDQNQIAAVNKRAPREAAA